MYLGSRKMLRAACCVLVAWYVLRAGPLPGLTRPAQTAPAQQTRSTQDAVEPQHVARRILRICADPNNLPFSNTAGEGFENRIAGIIARELGATVQYRWWPQRRGFVRNTLNAHRCDVVMGIAREVELVRTTAPYYRSSYVIVTRRGTHVRSLDDPALRHLRIGVQLVGDDGASTPPALALARRGITNNVVGYTVYGDYSHPAPTVEIVDAVARGEIDVALVWGPIASYGASRAHVPLDLVPIASREKGLPFSFEIAMGVRRGDSVLARTLDRVLERRRAEIDAVLNEFHIPRETGTHRGVTP